MDLCHALDSPALSPGFQYNLNVVTDIKVTSDFLNRDNKGCNTESKEDCSTRSYIKRVIESCDCLPLSLKTEEFAKVTFDLLILSALDFYLTVEHLLSRGDEMCQEYLSC